MLREDTLEVELHGITELREDVAVVLEGCRQLLLYLIIICTQTMLVATVLVDMGHTARVGKAEIEPRAQIFRTEHIVKVGDGGEVLSHQPPVEFVQSVNTMILALHVGSHKRHVMCQSVEKRTGKRLAQYRKMNIGILFRRREDHRDDHCHITDGRQTYDKYVLRHAFL